MAGTMDSANALEAALRFVSLINQRDVAALADLMTEDHVFIDSLGGKIQGRQPMRNAWTLYYKMFPDYSIVCHSSIVEGETVGLYGMASGTYQVGGKLPEANHWRIPAAWRAVVRDGQIAEWQVYADNSPVFQIMKSTAV